MEDKLIVPNHWRSSSEEDLKFEEGAIKYLNSILPSDWDKYVQFKRYGGIYGLQRRTSGWRTKWIIYKKKGSEFKFPQKRINEIVQIVAHAREYANSEEAKLANYKMFKIIHENDIKALPDNVMIDIASDLSYVDFTLIKEEIYEWGKHIARLAVIRILNNGGIEEIRLGDKYREKVSTIKEASAVIDDLTKHLSILGPIAIKYRNIFFKNDEEAK